MGRRYSIITDPQLSDLALLWDDSASDYRFSSYTNILALLEANFTLPDTVQKPATLKVSPAATGFNVEITSANDTHLILTPASVFATGTITLDGSTLQTHTISSDRDTVRRLITSGNGKRSSVKVSGTGSIEIYAVEFE